jgi:hypothetical protein
MGAWARARIESWSAVTGPGGGDFGLSPRSSVAAQNPARRTHKASAVFTAGSIIMDSVSGRPWTDVKRSSRNGVDQHFP